MKPKITSRVGVLALATSVALIASCGKSEKGGFTPTDLPSDGGNAPIAGKGFAISIPSTYEGSAFLHLFNDPTKACEIPNTATTPQEIQCLANVTELDLYMNGLPFTINYPAGLCKFSGQIAYYYYKHEPGTAPGSATASVTIDNGAPAQVTACGGGATLDAAQNRCTFASGEGSFDATGTPTCVYDHSADGGTGPNCCEGSYAFTITETTIERDTDGTISNTVIVPKVVRGSYGGKHANCLAGPALSGTVSTSGYPTYTMAKVAASGGTISYATPIPISSHGGRSVNFDASNFFAWDDYIIGDHAAAQRPRSLVPGNDRTGDFVRDTRESYMFDCLNAADELKHRIHLYIAEWDTVENYEAYSEDGDTSVSPNALDTDLDGTHCAVGEAIPGSGFCNDYGDWNFDDVLTDFVGDVFGL